MERNKSVAAIPSIPNEIVSKADLVRVRRELEALQESLKQASLRKQNTTNLQVSSLTERFAQVAQLDLGKTDDAGKLITLANAILSSAPVVHISFAATPNRAFMEKIVKWFRSEIQSNILLQIGLQPSIAAGCIIRTPNKQFDLSLRRYLDSKQGVLAQMIGDKQ